MEFAFHTRLDDLDTCRALSRTSAGVARNARKARRGMLLCALLCAAYLAYYVYVAVRDEAPIFRDPLGVIFLLGLGYCIVCWAKVRGGNYAELAAQAARRNCPPGLAQDARCTEDGFWLSEPDIETRVFYTALTRLVDAGSHYVLFTAPSMGAPLDKASLTGGDAGEFERFMQEKTGLTWERLDA